MNLFPLNFPMKGKVPAKRPRSGQTNQLALCSTMLQLARLWKCVWLTARHFSRRRHLFRSVQSYPLCKHILTFIWDALSSDCFVLSSVSLANVRKEFCTRLHKASTERDVRRKGVAVESGPQCERGSWWPLDLLVWNLPGKSQAKGREQTMTSSSSLPHL